MLPFDESVEGISSVSAVLLFLTAVAIALRFTARTLQKTPFGADGWLTIPAWLCFLGVIVSACYAMVHKVLATTEPSDKSVLMSIFSTFTVTQYVGQGLSIGSVGFTRLSTLFFYRRIFVDRRAQRGVFHVLTIIAITVTSIWIVSFIVVLITLCDGNFGLQNQPVAAIVCHNLPYLKSFSITSFVFDLMILILPIPMVFRLHTTLSRKLGIAAVFLLAAAGVAASCARMVINIEDLGQGPSTGHRDGFVENTQLYYYMILEGGLCLLATNLPSLWYFIGQGALPENVIRSFRSLVSLGSLRSNDNDKTKDNVTNDGVSSNSGIETTREFHVEYSPSTNDVEDKNRPETQV